MLTLLGRHSLIDLSIKARGDLHVDQHHTVEDTGICLGKVLAEALGDKRGIARYGSVTLPMEETLVTAALDLSGRAWFVNHVVIPTSKIGEFDTELVDVFWQAVSANALMNLHFVLHHAALTVTTLLKLCSRVRPSRCGKRSPSTRGKRCALVERHADELRCALRTARKSHPRKFLTTNRLTRISLRVV